MARAVATHPGARLSSDGLTRFGRFLWLVLVLLLIVQFRRRDPLAAPTVDWVVAAQLAAAALGGLVGIFLLRRGERLGAGGIWVGLYVLAAASSSLFSAYPMAVAGYTAMLAGGSLLILGLTASARSLADMERLERLWLWSMLAAIAVNSVNSVLFGTLRPAWEGVERLGMGWVHASVLGYQAAFTLCLSFALRGSPVVSWLVRLALLGVVVATRTRIPLLICILVLGLRAATTGRRDKSPGLVVVLSTLALGALAGVLVLNHVWLGEQVMAFVSRGDVESMSSLTGRTDIWRHGLGILTEDPRRLLTGFGYGVTRLTLNDSGALYFYAHMHNEALEVLFSMGLPGIVTWLGLAFGALTWVLGLPALMRGPAPAIAMRAATVMLAFLVSAMVGIPLAGKLTPMALIVIFYLAARDRAAIGAPIAAPRGEAVHA